jgi:hypothetical protein
VVEEAIAQPEACLDECSPSLWSAGPVKSQTPFVLERFDRGSRSWAEYPNLIWKGVYLECGKAGL